MSKTGRPPNQNRDTTVDPTGHTFMVRLTPQEYRALTAIVSIEQERVSSMGLPIKVSSSAVVRAMIKEHAVKKEVWG